MALADTNPKEGAAIPLELTVVDKNDDPIDLSTATQKDFVICNSADVEVVREASPVISGANNNIVTYTTIKDTDLTPAGTYRAYVDVTLADSTYFPTNSMRFLVKEKCAE